MRARPGLAVAAAVAALVLGPAAAPASATGDADVVLRMRDPRITEASGLAVSGRHPGVLWTHNDGGSVAEVFALDRRGRTVATVRLGDIDPFDPEALAPGRDGRGRPVLYLGDIGDNNFVREDVSVFRFREPARLRDTTVDVDWFRLTYPDGPHDAEALLVDPVTGRLLVATKDVLGGGLFRAPARLRTDRPNRLRRVGQVPSLITDGAYLRDGSFVLRSYTSVYRFSAPGEQVAREPLPQQPQGESVAADGDRLLVGTEGARTRILAVPVPGEAPEPTPGGSSGPAPEAASSSPAPWWQDVRLAAVGAGVLVTLGLLLRVLGRGRRD
jgi:hypothetical protein